MQLNIILPPPKRPDKKDDVWGLPINSEFKKILQENVHGKITDVNEFLLQCLEQLHAQTLDRLPQKEYSPEDRNDL